MRLNQRFRILVEDLEDPSRVPGFPNKFVPQNRSFIVEILFGRRPRFRGEEENDFGELAGRGDSGAVVAREGTRV